MGRSRLTYLAEKKGTRIRSIMGLTDHLAPLNPVELADALGIEVIDPSDVSGLSKSALGKDRAYAQRHRSLRYPGRA